VKKALGNITQEDLIKMISVVMRNRNEGRWIGHAIQSCVDHFENPEIIIVDNCSTDESLSIVKEFCFTDIKVYNIDDYTPGKSLNFGAQKASNENLLILSAHSQITKMIGTEEIDNLLDEHVAVFGKQIPIYRGRKINKRYVWSHFTDEPQENMWSDYENRNFLHNAFCFYRKETLQNYPFDENLASKEDRYWAKNIVRNQLTYYYEPALECNHHWTPNGATWKGIG
jgi:glycosyltransferase involved in cell wall biosynthesis